MPDNVNALNVFTSYIFAIRFFCLVVVEILFFQLSGSETNFHSDASSSFSFLNFLTILTIKRKIVNQD